mgnify:CR=1 FL=1
MVGHIEGSSITSDTYTSVSLDFMKEEVKKILPLSIFVFLLYVFVCLPKIYLLSFLVDTYTSVSLDFMKEEVKKIS